MIYSKETFIRGIEFLKNLTAEEYRFYRNFFALLEQNPEAVILQYLPWDKDPEESQKPEDFKAFEQKQMEENFGNFKRIIEVFLEPYKKFL